MVAPILRSDSPAARRSTDSGRRDRSRDAAGGAEFLDQADALLGVRPRVISGREEAELTFHGSLSGLPKPAGAVCVFDIGGGSTEIIRGRSAEGASSSVEHAVSLDIGSVRLFERHLRHDPPLPAEMARIEADIESALAAAGTPDPDAVLVRNLASHPDCAKLHVRTRQTFRHRDQIGNDFPMIDREPFSSAAKPSHHFVCDQKNAVFVAQRA